MSLFDVGLHKISLGRIDSALGLLVDDAIIAVETMAIKMEQGYSRLKAAGFVWQNHRFSNAHRYIDYCSRFLCQLPRHNLEQVNIHVLFSKS